MARTAPFALAALLSVIPSLALAAEPTAEDRALAEVLFRDAKALLDADKPAEACPKLVESQRLDPKPGTMLNLAVCHEKEGKTASAWSDFIEAASLASRAGQKEREDFARERAASLEATLSRIAVRVPSPVPGIAVKLDGRELVAAAWGTAAPIDPGEHAVLVTAPGYASWSDKFVIAPGAGTREVSIPALSPARGAAKEPSGQEGNTAQTNLSQKNPPGPEQPGGASPRLWAGVALGAVGLAGIVVGSVFGLRTFSKRDEGNAECVAPDYVRCTQAGLDLHAEAETSATISTVGFGVGIAGLGVGLALALTAPRASASPGRASASATWFVPWIGRGAYGGAMGASF